MLQYAAGRALSLARGTELRLDTYRLELQAFGPEETPRSYSLPVFAACRDVKTVRFWPVEVARNIPSLAAQVYKSYAKRCFPLSGLNCFDGYRTSDADSFYALPDDTYLIGHYFSAAFFQPYARQIREDFTFPAYLQAADAALAAEIRGRVSVAVHVRRTDYLTLENNNFSEVCTPEYYRRGIAWMEENLQSPYYYLFSDDVAWAAKNIPLPAGRYRVVSDPAGGRPDHDDLHLMVACRHAVIANSTFSWWAGWLGQAPDRIVVAPRQWYREYTGPSEDLIVPGHWRRL